MKKITEKNVAFLWKSGCVSRFHDDMGNEVEVVCAGRESAGPGCDFQDAVIEVNSQRITGDVEVHLSSDLWQKHRHHVNPDYNGIVLHVVMWQRGKLPVRLEMGKAIPTVVLSSYITERSLLHNRNKQNACPFISGEKVSKSVITILLQAGVERFKIKSQKFVRDLKYLDAEQVLYKGICRALGYSRNTVPFEMLADRLPIRTINELARGSIINKMAFTMGVAGLLPSQNTNIYSPLTGSLGSEIESAWSSLNDKPTPLSVSAWRFSNLRPYNHPVKRLVYLSNLIQKYERFGLVEGLSGLLREALPGEESDSIETGLLSGDGFKLIGKGRAREIIVNQVLPYLMAFSIQMGDILLSIKAVNAFKFYRALPDNELTRYMRQQLKLTEIKPLNACLQQGLLHIYHSHCREKNCTNCPVFKRRMTGRE
jgi:hypothetical protein